MQEYKQDVHLNDYLRVIKNRKNLIIVFSFISVLVVTVYSFMVEPVYRATATLLIDLESPHVLTTTGSVALETTHYDAYREYFQSQKEIIKSRGIIHQVFDEFKLDEKKEYRESKDPVKKFLKTIKVEPIRDTRLLQLHVENKDPKLAAAFANRIAEIYIIHNLSYITKSEITNLLKNEYLRLQTKLSEYTKIYKAKHPKMLRLKQEMDQIASRIQAEKERVGNFSKTASRTLSLDDSSSVLTVGLKANNISIQDRAVVPILPVRPKKRSNILLSMIISLFAGIGLAFFFEYLDDTVKGAEEVERLVKWPVLGSVPKIDCSGNGFGNSERAKPELFIQMNPQNPISEAYRAIRTSVLFSSTEEHPIKSFLVTSPGPQEGKTTSICNLAITMAHSQNQVLMVEADMRKPRLDKIFETKKDIGLSSFLSGQAKPGDLIQKTKIENLFLVSGGPPPPNPSELLASRKTKEFIDTVRKKFDFILFDTPPMAVVTDAVILSQAVDGTIIVLESGKTNRRMLKRINQMLKEAKGRIIGAILNKISLSDDSYYYYSYYSEKK